MEHSVIVQSDRPDHFIAFPIGIPDMRAEGTTENEALENVRQAIACWQRTAKIVRVQVPLNGLESNPWLEWAGRAARDPNFEAYLEEMQKARAADKVGKSARFPANTGPDAGGLVVI